MVNGQKLPAPDESDYTWKPDPYTAARCLPVPWLLLVEALWCSAV